MSSTHLHLMITHLPIFGSLLGALVLIHGLYTRSNQTKIAAFNVFIFSAIGGVIAYVTGEGAEETMEHIQGISESALEEHEEFAVFALASMVVLGLTSVVGLFFTIRKSEWARKFSFALLFLSLISFGIVFRTGNLGGKIRHTEINSSSFPSSGGEVESED